MSAQEKSGSKNNSIIVIGLAVVVVLAAFVLINPFGGSNSDEERTSIRLGTTISETGRLNTVASLYTDGRNFAIEAINAAGRCQGWRQELSARTCSI